MAQSSSSGRTSPIEIAKALGGINLPASKQGILRYAQDNGATGQALSQLEGMPDGDYNTMADIEHGALGDQR